MAVGLPLVIWIFQDRLIFFPRPLEPGRREQLLKRAPLVEEVALAAEDGTRLHGWLARPAAPGRAPLVIYFGGNAGKRPGFWTSRSGRRTGPGSR